MKAFRTLASVALLALALAGCATSTGRRELPPVDLAQAQANDARRAALDEWTLSGRIAVSNGNRGGSGRIDWEQQRTGYTVSLSAPVIRQSWRLRGDDRGARLEGIAGGPREDADVEALLLGATGWRVPVRALQDWVRGVAATAGDLGPAKLAYGPGAVPARLEQGGWSIEYQDWHPAAGDAPALPRRLVARNGSASVRLVVDEWQPGASR